MKRIILLMGIAATVLISGCKTEPEESVFLGQLYYTWGHASQEKVKGRVKELRQTNYWAAEENGKVVKGKGLTIEDRKTLNNMGGNFAEEYNESGIVLRSTSLDENGKVIFDFKNSADGKVLLGSEYYMNDTVRAKYKFRYEGNNLVETIVHHPVNDSVFMSIKYEYDKNGALVKSQLFNYKGEPQGYTIRTRNAEGKDLQVLNYNKDNKLVGQYDYTYNDKGERISQHQQNYTANLVIDYNFTYEYDKMGNYTAIIFQKDGKPFIYRAREIKYYD